MRRNKEPKPSLLSRFVDSLAGGALTLKDFGVTWDGDAGWRGFGGGSHNRYPGSDLNWESEAGTLWFNSAVSICIQYIWNKSVEPRPHVVYEDDEGMLQPVAKHPCTELLLHPNPEYHGNALLQARLLSYALNGNAYVLKVRGDRGKGAPVELCYIPHWLMYPIAPPDGGPTEFYAYRRPLLHGGFKIEAIPRANVIHQKNGLDPDNPRLGMSPFRAQYKAVVSDSEIDTTVAVVLRNRGIIGTLISIDPAIYGKTDEEGNSLEITPNQMEELVQKLAAKSTGDGRGGIAGLNLPVKVDRTTHSPQELQLTLIGERPQARLCATFGIDPMAVGLATTGTGKGAQYGAMKREAAASSYENCILPMLAATAEADTYQLLSDFPTVGQGHLSARRVRRMKWVRRRSEFHVPVKARDGNTRDFRVNFDYSEVRDLQENADAVTKRAVDRFKGGLCRLNEGREEIGLKPEEDPELGEKYWFQLEPAPNGQFGTPPTPNDLKPPAEQTPPDPSEQDLPAEEDEDDDG